MSGLSGVAAGQKKRQEPGRKEERKEVKAVAVSERERERGKGEEGTEIEAGGGCRETGECDVSRPSGRQEAADVGNSLRRTVDDESHKLPRRRQEAKTTR